MKNDAGVILVTQTIVKPEDEKNFLAWNERIMQAEATFPGFIGHKLEKPQPGINDAWISTVTFDTDKNLEAWLKSDLRKKLLDELNKMSITPHIAKAYSGFDFWFKPSKETKHTVWKENMLVLLTLYPVVFFLSFIQNPLIKRGMPFWLSLFFSNAASTAILGWITVPWLMKKFSWWINPPTPNEKKYSLYGAGIVLALYGCSLVLCWLLSKS
jgi:antibiotic biosynthesis monooxygenase (ABM) superfamily enzyme